MDTVKQHALREGLPPIISATYGLDDLLSPAQTNSIERPSPPTRSNAWQGRDQDGWTFHLYRLRSQHAGFDGDLAGAHGGRPGDATLIASYVGPQDGEDFGIAVRYIAGYGDRSIAEHAFML